MLAPSPHEQQWLAAYRKALDERHPGAVERLAVFGSKARGDAGDDSDLDVLLLVNTDDRMVQRKMRYLGHDIITDMSLAGEIDFLFVCIMVYSVAEWEQRVHEHSLFQLEVERDAVTV